MNLNIDVVIFIGFLIINLILGLVYSGGIKNIGQYAVGNRKFSTAAITATIAATFIGGGSFSMWTSGVYTTGLYHMLLGICDVLAFYIVCYIIAPRCGEFLGSISIASAMGQLYGPIIRTITALAGLFSVAGVIAMQFKVAAIILGYAFGDLVGNKLMILAALIVITYSALGGIRAVIMTDIVQLLTFAVFIPIVSLIIWNNLDNPEQVIHTISTNPIFDYKTVFHFNNYELINFILIVMAFLNNGLDPAMFQRIALASDVKQIKKSFFWAAFCILLITLLAYWVAILLLTESPTLDPDKIIPHLLENYSYIGLRGLVLAGIMAVLISTADSYINSAAILFAHDLVRPAGLIHSPKAELLVSRLASVIVGSVAIVLATSLQSMLELILFVFSFYKPIVTLPLYLAIFGFRSSNRVILLGIAVAFSITLSFYLYEIKLEPTIIAMLANALVVFSAHYLLREPGGWVGIKDPASLEELRHERRERNRKFIASIKNFNLMTFFKNNTPKQEFIYFSFGLFAMASMFCVMHSISKDIHEQYSWMSGFIFNSVLFLAAIFLSYPAWPERFKNENMIAIIWNIGSVYVMVFASSLLIIMSNFGQLPMMISMINLIVIAALMRWQTALLMLAIGVYGAITFFKWQVGVATLPNSNIELQFKFIYALLLIASSLIMFFKPKQEQQELTEEKVGHLSGRIGSQEKQLKEALSLRGEFIRNISHEYHAPMTGITSMAQTLVEAYYKLNDEQRLLAAKTILKSSIRLESFDANIATLSKLSKAGYELKLEPVDLSELLYNRVENCRKLYEENKEDREFILNIEEGITINGDKYYLTQVLDNLIINSITYCKKGKITLSLKQEKNIVHFTITDEGIGIPTNELEDIFAEFIVSSKTYTSAGGRGVGLALCKRVIEVHGGTISAESDGIKGATFKVSLLR